MLEPQRKGRCQARLSKSKQLLEAHKEELGEMSHTSCRPETDTRLKRSIDRIKEEQCLKGMDKKELQKEKESLLCKLAEAEKDGNEATKQVALLKDSICKLKNEKKMTCSEIQQVSCQKEKLLEKLDAFEETNRCLRNMLKDQHCQEEETQRLMEQKDLLLKRLAESDNEKAHLQMKLCDREREMDDLVCQLASEKDLTRTASDFSKSLECSKTHIQGQLKKCDTENNRLCTQIKSLECNEAKQKEELCKLLAELEVLKHKGDKEKEALRKSTQLQKQKIECCEETAKHLSCQLKGKDARLDEALCAIESWRSQVNNLMCEKSQLEEDINCLETRVQGLIDENECLEKKACEVRQCIMEKIQRQTKDNAYIKLECERLKATQSAVEEKLNMACGEVQQLKCTLKQYESLVESYKCQVQRTRMEADEICLKLQKCEREKHLQKEEMCRELEALKRKFNCRLSELEQLPEMLKYTECKLQECQDQLVGYEKKNGELSCIFSELRVRVKNWKNGGSSTKLC